MPAALHKPSMESIRTRRASSSFSKKGKKSKTASSSGPETKKKEKIALSSSSTPKWKHEVFLSFHGPDTRLSFTEHLYVALKQKGILSFKDDEKLERGKDISQELLKAIQESLYAIIILSANYGSSKWCLKELAEIVKCKTQTKLEILPIFYDVDPSDVRKQTWTFEKAFDKHAKDPETNSWRAALTEVGNIAGWDLRNRSVRKLPKFCPALPGVVWLGDASELMLPNDLRLLEWYGYPFKSLALGFQPNSLIELRLPYSHIEQLWSNDPIESLGNLKCLDLSECKSLTKKLNLTITPNLESLHLEGCENLSNIHSSTFHLGQLKLLNLCGCTSLQSLPDENDLKSLERFYLSHCSGLKKLPDALGNMTALWLLYLNGTSIKELPFSIERLSCLSVLSLKDCKKLSTLPSVFGGLLGLSSLKLVELPCLRFRDMDNAEITRFWRHVSS